MIIELQVTVVSTGIPNGVLQGLTAGDYLIYVDGSKVGAVGSDYIVADLTGSGQQLYSQGTTQGNLTVNIIKLHPTA